MAEKKLKRRLVELIIDEESERFGVEAISLVEFPAIGRYNSFCTC